MYATCLCLGSPSRAEFLAEQTKQQAARQVPIIQQVSGKCQSFSWSVTSANYLAAGIISISVTINSENHRSEEVPDVKLNSYQY